MRLVAALGLSLLAACVSDPDLGDAELMGQNLNGQNLNGQNLNGQNLNGQNLNGQNLNGPDNGTFTIWTSLQGARQDGKAFDSLSLSSTVFSGVKGSSTVSGVDMVQTELVAMRGDGRTVRLRLREVVPPAAGETAWRYLVEYREDDLLWYPVCENAAGPVLAIPLNGTWDHRQGVPGGGGYSPHPDRFTFACENQGAIGKCVAAGYEPWTTVGGVGLTNHHAACVRLMRADFCGDGRSWTQDGTLVNLYDGLGIQVDTESWYVESEWDQHGARCFSQNNRSSEHVACYDERVKQGCGSSGSFSTGALLMNETFTRR